MLYIECLEVQTTAPTVFISNCTSSMETSSREMTQLLCLRFLISASQGISFHHAAFEKPRSRERKVAKGKSRELLVICEQLSASLFSFFSLPVTGISNGASWNKISWNFFCSLLLGNTNAIVSFLLALFFWWSLCILKWKLRQTKWFT